MRSLKRMESLQNRLQPYSEVTPLTSLRGMSQALWKRWFCVDADA